MLQKLTYATATSDIFQIMQIIEEIRLYDPFIAERLIALAHEYEYQNILKLIQAKDC